MAQIPSPKAPNLPLSPAVPDRQYLDQNNNALRLYFNRLDTALQNLLNYQGGKYVNFPYAAVQRTTNKTFTANTPTQITFDKNDFLNGCTNDGTDGIHVENPGIYNYQFSVQWANTSATIYNAYIWLRVNAADAAGTASKFDIPAKHGSSDGYLIAAANFYLQLNAGDYVEMYAAVENSAAYMEAYAANSAGYPMPSIPSVVATLSFVSSPPP